MYLVTTAASSISATTSSVFITASLAISATTSVTGSSTALSKWVALFCRDLHLQDLTDIELCLQRPPPPRPCGHETLVSLQTTVNRISCYYGLSI
ncbi:hypothetical protein AtEden1_Chr5g0118681 [Arabidopsis thaliana]